MNDRLGEELASARARFEELCAGLRPDLHRFCTRMTGNPCDGEDVLQDALVLAFYRLPELSDPGSFRAWLFRIAHNRCVDFLRGRGRRRFEALDGDEERELASDPDEQLDHKRRTEQVFAGIVAELPPRERACVVLKDALGWSLEETAEVTGSSVGAVKAALHRGRAKLERAAHAPVRVHALPAGHRALVERYLSAFNRRDWDAVRALLSDDAWLEVVHRGEGPFRDACYLLNYGRLSWSWRLALAYVDGLESVVHYREHEGRWQPQAIVQLAGDGERITLIRDYIHVDYLLQDAVVR